MQLLPDQSHIDRVRDALWSRTGGASVMVGSGLSRCARKTRPDAGDPPLWGELASQMYNRLYPQGAGAGRLGESGEAAPSDNPLRLAQEYEAAFGRTDLRQFLRESIRDEDFEPGETHFRLLKLPWGDVFTTNWDTLLERTSTRVAEHDYSLVRNVDDIPIANQPRVVKLHGSLAEYIPPILTEEDYRTYPTKFAPFVNTVQQAMMETVFCLIGFSGDDPNFLHWSGWVRDNLGDAAPKIYLAGLLDLSPHRRRMLEDRGVVPIDVARHPRAHEWPDHLRPRYAVEWVLHTLEAGEPYDFVDWPSPSNEPKSEVPEYLQPVVELTYERPKVEPDSDRQVDPKDRQDGVGKTLKVWTHNRRIYPGWLVFPTVGERNRLKMNTDKWEPHILSAVPDFAPVERLNAVRELVWRREILLEPMSQHLESAAEKVLGSIDCQRRTINGHVDSPVKWSAIREAWRTIALALVTDARLSLNGDLFDQRIDVLVPFFADDSDVGHRIQHERCLWASYSMDFDALEVLLGDWHVEECDPAWMVRKAAMLWEVDRNDEAAELVARALDKIRSIRDDDRSLAGASREGWALWSAATLENRRALRKKWDGLASLKCDALLEKDLIVRRLRGEGRTNEARAFDLGRKRVRTPLFSGATHDIAAYRAIRLSEVAGLAPTIYPKFGIPLAVASDILGLAAGALSAIQPDLAIRLALRVCNSETDSILDDVLSRTRVAVLPADSVAVLTPICIRVIRYAITRLVTPDGRMRWFYWIKRMRVALEVLSRLALRMTPHMVEEVLDMGVDCYGSYQVTREHWLHDAVGSVLKRCWEALPSNRRNCRALDLLGLPIVGMDNFTASIEEKYPDPGTFIQLENTHSIRTPDSDRRWRDVIGFLIRGLNEGGEARKRASIRILSVALGGILTDAESSAVAQALWSETHTPPDGLPSNTMLDDWGFFLLPEPSPGLAEKRFLLKWLSRDINEFRDSTQRCGNIGSVPLGVKPVDPARIEAVLWNLGAAISGLRNHNCSLSLTVDKRNYVVELIERWINMDVPSYTSLPPYPQDQAREPTRWALQGLASIIAEFVIPAPVAKRLYEKLKGLTESGIPGFALIHGLVKAMDDRFDELATWLRVGLVSNDPNLAGSAVSGLHSWLKATAGADSSPRPPPDDVVREIGFVIAARRHAALPQALQLARWLFEEGTQEQREIVRILVLHGLRYLAEELRYDREHEENIDVPLLRWLCAQLAHSMAQSGLQDDPAVVRWLELAEQDPLPEVRFAVSPRTALDGDG